MFERMPKSLQKNKAGVLGQMQSLVTGLVALAIVIAVGFLILGEVDDTDVVKDDANASAAVDDTQDAMSIIPDFLDIIVITVIGVALLGLVMYFRAGSGQR